jgi:methanol--5-hydroxybenzimidazolylcobamide Co-methyltransferase
MVFRELAIPDADDLVFGTAPRPLRTRSGLEIGAGTVYPELNFTLPPMALEESTFAEVRAHYEQIVSGALKRAAELQAPGVVLEFETLPAMTENPKWAVELTRLLLETAERARADGAPTTALRLTPNDNREMIRPPAMRDGRYWDSMLETCEGCCALGPDLLSIESVGGKEVHDDALLLCDIRQVLFALCVMGVRDMRFLWRHLVEIAQRHGVNPAGDSGCGFGNTAMVLAEQKLIPRVFAAVVRPITAVRSLVAFECGAVGPGKDCAYENVILKAITGFPMSMEGRTAAGAHSSPVGNVAAATCDLWSNESIQNVKLLGGMAPTVCMEQLIYDCRLMNAAAARGRDSALLLRDWLVESDAGLDPQAWVLTPQHAIEFAREIVAAPDAYHAGAAVARKAVDLLRRGLDSRGLKIAARELRYLDSIEASLEALPDEEDEFIRELMPQLDLAKLRPADYGLPPPNARR